MKGTAPKSSISALPAPYPPEKILILGAGRFGHIAAQRLSRRHSKTDFLVVDRRQERLDKIHEELGLPVHVEDTISYLGKGSIPDDLWIVPAVPLHVAFQWILTQLNKIGKAQFLPVPESVDSQVPNPYRVPGGTLYASFATFICPDVCNEPDDICTFTKQPRPGNLFERLSQIKLPGYDVVVVRSWQLAPGVGGYPGSYLKDILSGDIIRRPGNYLIATSCRCHGVIDALTWEYGA